jgi:hypothetical protein
VRGGQGGEAKEAGVWAEAEQGEEVEEEGLRDRHGRRR